MKQRNAFIVSKGLGRKQACPGCSAPLGAVTRIDLDEPETAAPFEIAGKLTMCTRCGGILKFLDNHGALRILRSQERDEVLRLHPILRNLLKAYQREHNLGSKNYGSR